MMRRVAGKQDPSSGLSGFLYLLSVAFPSWGALLASLYLLLGSGLRFSGLREFWRV